jgi:hypothetical protein
MRGLCSTESDREPLELSLTGSGGIPAPVLHGAIEGARAVSRSGSPWR